MIRAERLSVHFRRFRKAPVKALDDVTLQIREGDFFALLGENGAGKSTAMHAFLGLIRPTAGSVTMLGRPVRRGDALFERVGYIPEEPLYPSYLTVREALDYYASLFAFAITPAARDTLLDRLGLGGFRDFPVGKCSKGMKQKLGIAQALLNEPSLLLLDEPMRGLDPVGVRDFREILVDMHRRGTTIVMNSHILAEVESVATRVAILQRGKLVLDGSVADLTHLDSDDYAIEYEGDGFAPEYLADVELAGNLRRATLPKERLAGFVAELEARGGRLESCAHRKRTLEESFLAVVGGSQSGDGPSTEGRTES